MFKIYLAGPIDRNDLEAANKWRDFVTEEVKERIAIRSPMKGKTARKVNTGFTPNEIVFRDLRDIRESDLVLVYVPKKRDKDKALWGTPCEVIYAWERGIPVILVTDDKRLADHYWVRAMCVKILPDLEQAIDYIWDYWYVYDSTYPPLLQERLVPYGGSIEDLSALARYEITGKKGD